jgi:hypothetical protein
MTATLEMETGGVWILGLDAQRPGRDRIARRIERDCAGRVRVRDLAEPQLRRWRANALGTDSPTAPTLFEVTGDSVRAWEGWRMGLALGRVLGPTVTLRVMRDLREDEALLLPRRSSLLPSGTGHGNPRTLWRSRELTGPELGATVARAARNRDVRNLAGEALSSSERLAAARPVAFEHVLRGGTRTQATVFKLSVVRLLVHHLTILPSSPRARSTARLWQTTDERSVLMGISEGGAIQPPPHVAETTRSEDVRDERAFCTSIDLSCVLNLAEAGGGCSTFFYTLPDTCVRPAPLGGACAGGYRKPSRRCCATFEHRPAPSDHNP